VTTAPTSRYRSANIYPRYIYLWHPVGIIAFLLAKGVTPKQDSSGKNSLLPNILTYPQSASPAIVKQSGRTANLTSAHAIFVFILAQYPYIPFLMALAHHLPKLNSGAMP
jgi:hypothetical protein